MSRQMCLNAHQPPKKYEAKLEFPERLGGAKQKTFHGESMDIFWNYTMTARHKGEKKLNLIYI